MGRQRAAVRAALGRSGPPFLAGSISSCGKAGGLDLLGLLQPQQELILGQALGPAPKAMALQALMIWRSRSFSARSLGKQRLERVRIVWRGL